MLIWSHLGIFLRVLCILYSFYYSALDTLGHTFRPISKESREHLTTVDSDLKECVALLEQFYDVDGKTAFVLTSDHGKPSAT